MSGSALRPCGAYRVVTRGLDANVRLKLSGVDWLGDIPYHWEVRRLKSQVINVVDRTRESSVDDIYLALENVESWTGRYVVASEQVIFDSQVKRFRVGDVLFGKLRPYLAKVACPDRSGVCVGEFLVLRPIDDNLSAKYLEYLLRSNRVISEIDSSTFGAKMPRADWRFIGDLRIPLPPLDEQRAIVEHLGDASARIDGAIDRTKRMTELLQEYRICLIDDVVMGKLDVRRVGVDSSLVSE